MNESTRTRRPVLASTLRRVLALVAAIAATVGMALPANAASAFTYQGTYSMNTYYGWSSGWGYIPQDLGSATVAGHVRDVRNDGYCATVQMRGVTQTGATTGAYNVGFTCSTTNSTYISRTLGRPSGHNYDGIQVRSCQSNRSGGVVGTCSGWVSVQNWRVVYP